jgi:hypothetical protein
MNSVRLIGEYMERVNESVTLAAVILTTGDDQAVGQDSAPINIGEIDPGIRKVVRFLRAAGANTTDSGDGKKPDGLEYPHVFIRCYRDDMGAFIRYLEDLGLNLSPIGVDSLGSFQVQWTEDPAEQRAAERGYSLGCLMIMGLTDVEFRAAVIRSLKASRDEIEKRVVAIESVIEDVQSFSDRSESGPRQVSLGKVE